MSKNDFEEILTQRPPPDILRSWRKAVVNSDLELAKTLLEEEKRLHPDEPVSNTPLASRPLMRLLSDDHNPDVYEKQALLIDLLIQKGASLYQLVPPGLLPADIALTSLNPQASSVIVGLTIVQDMMRKSRRPYGNPLSQIFTVSHGDSHRKKMMERVVKNHKAICERLNKVVDEDKILRPLKDEHMDDFWKKPFSGVDINSLPAPSEKTSSIITEFQRHAGERYMLLTDREFYAWWKVSEARVTVSRFEDLCKLDPKGPA